MTHYSRKMEEERVLAQIWYDDVSQVPMGQEVGAALEEPHCLWNNCGVAKA